MRAWWRDVRQHVASNLWMMKPVSRWDVIREYGTVLLMRAHYQRGALVCRLFGHSHETEVTDLVFPEYAVSPDDGLYHKPRIVDIDGGRVDWFCPRCGVGGSGRF